LKVTGIGGHGKFWDRDLKTFLLAQRLARMGNEQQRGTSVNLEKSLYKGGGKSGAWGGEKHGAQNIRW